MSAPRRPLLLAVVAWILVLAFGEASARLAATVGSDFVKWRTPEAEPWLEPSAALGWERKPSFEGMVGGAMRAFDARGYFTVDSDEVEPRPGRRRVVFIGDSSTFGFGAPTDQSFAEVVERQLPDVDAINLGVLGYSSFQGRLLVEQRLADLRADLLVVSFNFNDRRYMLRPEERDSVNQFERGWRGAHSRVAALGRALEYSYGYRALRQLLQMVRVLPAEMEGAELATVVPRVDEAAYRANLLRIEAVARSLHVPVLFLALRDNPEQTDPLRRGLERHRQHDTDGAIVALRTAVRGAPMFSDLARVHLARVLTEAGDAAGAAQVQHAPTLYDSFSGGRVIRLDSDYNAIMHQVAAETGAPIVDGYEAVEVRTDDFVDYCHFGPAAHRRLGELLATRISDVLHH